MEPTQRFPQGSLPETVDNQAPEFHPFHQALGEKASPFPITIEEQHNGFVVSLHRPTHVEGDLKSYIKLYGNHTYVDVHVHQQPLTEETRSMLNSGYKHMDHNPLQFRKLLNFDKPIDASKVTVSEVSLGVKLFLPHSS